MPNDPTTTRPDEAARAARLARGRRAVLGMVAVLAAGASMPVASQGLLEAWRARRAEQGRGDAADPLGDDSSGGEGAGALPAGARVERDIAYGPAADQRLDVYAPPDVRGAAIVLMVHGGAWMLGDKARGGVVTGKAAHWLPKGIVFVSTNYRMARPVDPLAQADDVARALAFVQQNASRWGADAGKVVLMGHSSGAHLVALLNADRAIAARQGAKPWLGTVSLDSAALDVTELMQRQHPRFYDRVFGADPASWARNSPTRRLTSDAPPMLLVCSSRRDDSCPAARAFATKAQALGARAEVAPFDLAHGEINSRLGVDAGYTARVDAFLRTLGIG